ncbi:MAG: hypothetical protein KatS3mg114_0010 [Planctomycetaceae bacterium]|nr:MAG: hypothetical protein KatS3mg114_0010 [Planctomycetaceae bacterium]
MRLFRYLLAAGGGALGATYVLTGGGTSIPREVWQWVKYLPEPAAVSSWEPATPRQEEAAAAESGPNSQAKSRAPQQNLKAESSDDRSPAMHASSIPLVQRHQSGGAEGDRPVLVRTHFKLILRGCRRSNSS